MAQVLRKGPQRMYQLTQAMGSGRPQGDEFRSIIENAPLLAKYIEDYMRNVKGATGTMKEWSAQGMLTADVIKNAVFNMTDEVNAKFDEMPMTWGQVWQTMKKHNDTIHTADIKGDKLACKSLVYYRSYCYGRCVGAGVLLAMDECCDAWR